MKENIWFGMVMIFMTGFFIATPIIIKRHEDDKTKPIFIYNLKYKRASEKRVWLEHPLGEFNIKKKLIDDTNIDWDTIGDTGFIELWQRDARTILKQLNKSNKEFVIADLERK